jgi:RNA polymerase sigma-70 factor (ECF subfamily)
MKEREQGGVPDDALIRTTLAGDDSAFGELVERYKGRAFAVAVGIVGDGDDARDVVQDSFIKAYYKLKEFRFGSNFYTWFYRLVVNQAIDRWRKSARSAEASPPDSFAYPRTPEDLARDRELGDALQRAVDALPEYHRAVIVLREVDGMAYDEIAKVLGCSVGTVMSRLHYARGKLKESLKSHREG